MAVRLMKLCKIILEAVDMWARWAASEMDWKLAEATGPEDGDQWHEI